ncbi:MAG: PorV/PorQ family protein [Candidatus Marinimicrobia bacterium]|nr:PorV/PorQ family protein [Candidatus Neomarinimicrobiota bacterium]
MRILLTLCTFFMIVPTLTFCQIITKVTKVGTTSAPFLKIEPGARAVAMGGAFVAVDNDATAIYWNPAGIARLPKTEIILIHTQWLAGTSFDFAGFILPLGTLGTIGASITSLSMSEMKVRTVFYPEGTGEKYGAGDVAIGLSYARNLTDRFSIGFNGKYIQQHIWHMSSSAFAVDIGTLFTTQFNGMKIGMSISNFGTKMRLDGKDTSIKYDLDPIKYGNNDRIPANLETDDFSLPLLFRVGLAMDVLKSSRNRITLAIDAVHPNDNTENLNLGTEYIFNNMISLRTGYKNLFTKDSEEGFTAGAGIKYGLHGNVLLKIDFSYQDFGNLNNVHRFSIGLEL